MRFLLLCLAALCHISFSRFLSSLSVSLPFLTSFPARLAASRSGRRWAESVSEPPPSPGDSFGQYLLQLPAQLAGAAGADCWRQLRGRVLLRLHARRAAQLSAAGLRAACSLFLTLIHAIRDDQQLVGDVEGREGRWT